jgi:hypothetical protein
MRLRRGPFIVLLPVLALSSCGPDRAPPDGSSALPDSGPAVDDFGSAIDGSLERDGGTVHDTRDEDGGRADAASLPPDASEADTRSGDGGSGDAGTDGPMMLLAGRHRLVAGSNFACAIDHTGQPVCWGGVQVNAPPRRALVSLGAGVSSVCGIDAAGTLSCWSPNSFTQAITSFVPQGTTFTDVSVGGKDLAEFACAVRANGTAICWQDVAGADGTLTAVPTDGRFARLSLGAHHGCGVTLAGTVRCWGALTGGLDAIPPGAFTEIAAGQDSACSLASPLVRCWGAAGALEGGFPKMAVPAQVSLHAGSDGVCLLVTDGRVGCYGPSTVLATFAMNERFAEIALGGSHLCGVRRDDSVACFTTSGGAGVLAPPAGLRVVAR